MANVICTTCGKPDERGYNQTPYAAGPICQRCYNRAYRLARGIQPRSFVPTNEHCACGRKATRRGPQSGLWRCRRCCEYERNQQQPPPRAYGLLNTDTCACGNPAVVHGPSSDQPVCHRCYSVERRRLAGMKERPKVRALNLICTHCDQPAWYSGAGEPLCQSHYMRWYRKTHPRPRKTPVAPKAKPIRATVPLKPAPQPVLPATPRVTPIAPLLRDAPITQKQRNQNEQSWQEAKLLLESEAQTCWCGRSFAGAFYERHIASCEIAQAVQERAA